MYIEVREMDCEGCEKKCVMKGKYKGVYPCMVCEHAGMPKLNEYCVMCIKQQVCCFKEVEFKEVDED